MKAWLVLLLAAAVVSAQEVTEVVRPSGFGGAHSTEHLPLYGAPDIVGPIVNAPGHGGEFAGATIVSDASILGRKMLSQRRLMGNDTDGSNVLINPSNNVLSNVGKTVCPSTNATWAPITAYNENDYALYGDLVHDNGICNVATAGVGNVLSSSGGYSGGRSYGGAAQDFGTARPNWESYGWSLFKLQNPPDGTYQTTVKIQGVTLHVLGNVGTGHPAGVNCSVKGVSVAFYNSEDTGDYNPTGDPIYMKYVDFASAAADDTFKWSTNQSAALYLDIAQAPDTFPIFQNSTYYWMRIKLHTDYGGTSGTGKCFVFWGLSSTVTNGVAVKGRWQERVGGSSGYSTTCTGAATSGNTGGAKPGKFQTWWNCWNNGISASLSGTGRRCSTYRATVNPPIPSNDCLHANRAQFNDYNYAFSGMQGESGFSDGPGGAGGDK